MWLRAQARRNVPAAVQYTPDVDAVLALKVEHDVGIAFQCPRAQAGQFKLVGVAGRTCCRKPGNVLVCLFECVNEAKRDVCARFKQIPIQRLLYVAFRPLARDERFGVYSCAPVAVWRCTCARRRAK